MPPTVDAAELGPYIAAMLAAFAQPRHWFALLCAVSLGACAPLHVTPPAATANTEAILILPGLGLKRDALEPMKKFGEAAEREGFDFYLADYQRRQGIDEGVEALQQFVGEQDLERYERVHVFTYILGGYTFNRFQQKHPLKNLGNVAYDRSPLQELAPELGTTGWIRIPAWVSMGPVLKDLAATSYSPLPQPHDSKVGLLVENRATPFIRARKDHVLEMIGTPSFDPSSFGQPYDAVIHVPFNHDEMYHELGAIGPELIHFFKHGTFTPKAAQKPLGIDPFAESIAP